MFVCFVKPRSAAAAALRACRRSQQAPARRPSSSSCRRSPQTGPDPQQRRENKTKSPQHRSPRWSKQTEARFEKQTIAHTLAWSATCNHARRRSHSAHGGVECYACAADACGNSGAAAIGPVGARHAAQEGMYVYCSMLQDAAAVQQSRRTCLSSLSSVIGVESSETNLTRTGPGAKHLSSAEPCTGGESMWPVEGPRSRSRLRRTRTAIRASTLCGGPSRQVQSPFWGNEGCVKGMAVVVRCSCRGQ